MSGAPGWCMADREKWYHGDLDIPDEHSLDVAISEQRVVNKEIIPEPDNAFLYIKEQHVV